MLRVRLKGQVRYVARFHQGRDMAACLADRLALLTGGSVISHDAREVADKLYIEVALAAPHASIQRALDEFRFFTGFQGTVEEQA